MLIHPTADRLRLLSLRAMAEAYLAQPHDQATLTLDFDARLALLVDAEVLARENRKLARYLKEAKLRIAQASLENLDYASRRELDRALIRQLATGRWVSHANKVEGAVLSKELAAHFAAAVYDQSFGETTFHDLPGDSRARTRLGLDTLRISLTTPTQSPFGVTLNELVIPGHMAPKNAGDLPAELLCVEQGTVYLRVGDREYSYSRFGLEGRDAGDQSAR